MISRKEPGFQRAVNLRRLGEETFDVAVIGGGITGAGVALEAAARGLRTALVERFDFASGTSSKSSKLVHGGLRYLQQREFSLVHESLVERHRLLANAPHLVEPLGFVVPLFGSGGAIDKTVSRGYSTALFVYDLFGGWRIGKLHRRLRPDEVIEHFPTLRTDRLVSGLLYYDARADDARLTLSLMRTAALDFGAVVANYAPVIGLQRDSTGRVDRLRVAPSIQAGTDTASPSPGSDAAVLPAPRPAAPTEEIEVRARAVVNATGIFADSVSGLARPGRPPALRPAKGVHVSVPSGRLPCDLAAVLAVPGEKRSIFVIPSGDFTYIGTTDTDYVGSLENPRVDTADIDYLLRAVNAAVTSPLSRADITATWAGLRPLLSSDRSGAPVTRRRTADLSRRHAVIREAPGLISITGGKLTTYRRMAADTLKAVETELGIARRPSPTKRLLLRGGSGYVELNSDLALLPTRLGQVASSGHPTLSLAQLQRLLHRYGDETAAVLSLCRDRPDLLAPLSSQLPYLGVEVVYAARAEMAMGIEDVLARRTRALLEDARSAQLAAPRVAQLLAEEHGWSDDQRRVELASFDALVSADLAGVEDDGPKDRASHVGQR